MDLEQFRWRKQIQILSCMSQTLHYQTLCIMSLCFSKKKRTGLPQSKCLSINIKHPQHKPSIKNLPTQTLNQNSPNTSQNGNFSCKNKSFEQIKPLQAEEDWRARATVTASMTKSSWFDERSGRVDDLKRRIQRTIAVDSTTYSGVFTQRSNLTICMTYQNST